VRISQSDIHERDSFVDEYKRLLLGPDFGVFKPHSFKGQSLEGEAIPTTIQSVNDQAELLSAVNMPVFIVFGEHDRRQWVLKSLDVDTILQKVSYQVSVR